jgi:hypothetical protein
VTSAHTWNLFLMSSKKENATRLSPSAKRHCARARASAHERRCVPRAVVRRVLRVRVLRVRAHAWCAQALFFWDATNACLTECIHSFITLAQLACPSAAHVFWRCKHSRRTRTWQKSPPFPRSSLTVDAGRDGRCLWYAGYAWGGMRGLTARNPLPPCTCTSGLRRP